MMPINFNLGKIIAGAVIFGTILGAIVVAILAGIFWLIFR